MVRQGQPGLGHVRLEGDGAAQRGQGLVAATDPGEGQAEFVMDRRGGLFGGERFEQGQGGRGIAAQPVRRGEDQAGGGMAGDDAEDLAGLLGRQRRVAAQQPRGVGEGDFETGGDFRHGRS